LGSLAVKQTHYAAPAIRTVAWVASWLKVRKVLIHARARRARLDRQAPDILPNTIDAETNGAPPRAEGFSDVIKKHGEAYCAQRPLRV
jgi:hypothetical protein